MKLINIQSTIAGMRWEEKQNTGLISAIGKDSQSSSHLKEETFMTLHEYPSLFALFLSGQPDGDSMQRSF